MKKNNIIEKARDGRMAYGCSLVFPSAELVELLGMAGLDFVNLDGEHGLFSPESVDSMCRAADAAGLTVTARVPAVEASVINQFLDRGVQGIVGPHVDNAEQARALVDACRYAPDGHRSWGGGRGTLYNDSSTIGGEAGTNTDFMAKANREMLVIAQLETLEAVENLDAILAVAGIDAFTHGPNDLAQSMGFPGQPEHPRVVEVERQINDRVHAEGRKIASDLFVHVYAPDLILDAARRFLETAK